MLLGYPWQLAKIKNPSVSLPCTDTICIHSTRETLKDVLVLSNGRLQLWTGSEYLIDCILDVSSPIESIQSHSGSVVNITISPSNKNHEIVQANFSVYPTTLLGKIGWQVCKSKFPVDAFTHFLRIYLSQPVSSSEWQKVSEIILSLLDLNGSAHLVSLFHVAYEDLKLYSTRNEERKKLGGFLVKLNEKLGWTAWLDFYREDGFSVETVGISQGNIL